MTTPTDTQAAADTIRMVADRTRLAILILLAEGERFVKEIVEAVQMEQPAVSHHLRLLKFGGFVSSRREGKMTFYRATDLGRKFAGLAREFGE